jgi:hypothetical protein
MRAKKGIDGEEDGDHSKSRSYDPARCLQNESDQYDAHYCIPPDGNTRAHRYSGPIQNDVDGRKTGNAGQDIVENAYTIGRAEFSSGDRDREEDQNNSESQMDGPYCYAIQYYEAGKCKLKKRPGYEQNTYDCPWCIAALLCSCSFSYALLLISLKQED